MINIIILNPKDMIIFLNKFLNYLLFIKDNNHKDKFEVFEIKEFMQTLIH